MALDTDRRRRSWPYPPTHLERLAERAGLDADELRAHLRCEIRERVLEREGRSERVELKCERCGVDFSLSRNRVNARAREGVTVVLCWDCTYPAYTTPSSRDRGWVRKLDRETREAALAGLAALR